MNFVAIDVETAQGKRWSVCQIGIVLVNDGIIIDRFSYLIQPPNNEYSIYNTRVHGLSEKDTINSPDFSVIWNEIKGLLSNNLIVAHNSSFDIDCIQKTLLFYGLKAPSFNHECTYRLTNKKLIEITQAYSIELTSHHDALSDAEACAKVYIKLLEGIEPDFSKIKSTTANFNSEDKIKGDLYLPDFSSADPSSLFYNQKVVFTGVLSKISRKKAAVIVKEMGADIDSSITKRTNFVILGEKPGPVKMKKIKEYNKDGALIKILSENEFLDIIS